LGELDQTSVTDIKKLQCGGTKGNMGRYRGETGEEALENTITAGMLQA